MYLCKIQCAPTPVSKGACVCVCVFGRAARRLLSSRVRRAGKLARHADRLKCYSLPEVRSALRKFVILFHLSDSSMAGVKGRVFVLICCRHLNTDTLVCNRPVKVTKKFVWPCCESFICSFSLLFGTEVGQAVVLVQFLTAHTSSINPSHGYTLDCSAFSQILDFVTFSVNLSITHACFFFSSRPLFSYF